jgi:hypothetical protein
MLSRRWFYGLCAFLALLYLVVTCLLNTVSARIYGPIYPLYDILIGGLLAACFIWIERQWQARHNRPSSGTTA